MERGRPPANLGFRVRGAVPAAFVEDHAVSAEDAIAYRPQGWFQRREFDRLVAANVIRAGRPGTHYLDLAAYAIDAERQSKRATWMSLAVSLVIVAVALLFYRG